MNDAPDNPPVKPAEPRHPWLGLTRRHRFALYRWLAVAVACLAGIWACAFLQPHRWYTYTDVVSFAQAARDVTVGYVLWRQSEPVAAGVLPTDVTSEPVISSDGTRMIYARVGKEGSRDLFLRRWDGTGWSDPRPLRALNSNFDEVSPSLSGDGRFLYFASNRPGGRGGYDIWAARWDGVEYAWPLPMTNHINTQFDELGPAISPDNIELYFSSNRPRERVDETAAPLTAADVERLRKDHDLYSADRASDDLPYDLIVERQLSMLYSLREGALNDKAVMGKLGGTAATEAAVDRALAYLAGIQAADGRWDLGKDGGPGNHSMAATGLALLAFYGRGQRHDEPCRYRDVVSKGINWLMDEQDKVTGDLRGNTSKGDMYDHGIASLALVEAYGVTKDLKLRPRAQTAVDFIVESQHEAGGWRYQPKQAGDLSVTGWVIMALASARMSGLNVAPKTLQGAQSFLDSVSGGKHGGAFGYTGKPGSGGHSPAMNAVGFFCRQLLGLSSASELAWESSSLVDRKGLDVADLYFAYYGTLASYQNQGPAWLRWMASMQEQFVAAQRQDGSWVAAGAHGGSMGTIVATSLVALCLEAHYRYTPLYGLGFEPDPAGPAPASAEIVAPGQIPEPPLFRHAVQRAELSSPADDFDPVVTDHGDFLYFASRREGGEGGADIYRSRFERVPGEMGRERLVPGEPKKLGPEINSPANESAPATRTAGFELLFNSNRDGNAGGLYSAKSQRVERRYDYSKMPDGAWLSDNIGWIIALAATIVLLILSTRFALHKPAALHARADQPATGATA